MKKLAILLGQTEAEVNKLIAGLEARTGFESIDVSFLAAHNQDLRRAIASLGLDPDDTTGPELYQALQAKFKSDSILLDRSLGITGSQSIEQKLASLKELIHLAGGQPEAWTIKTVALKRALKELPPNKTRKRLGYRTVESMLKRRQMCVICHLARQIESPTWQAKFEKAIAKSAPSYFELRPVSFVLSSDLDDIKSEPITGTILLGARFVEKHSLLSLSVALYGESQKISRLKQTGLENAVPILSWWQKWEHLSDIKDEQAISFNIKDVAHNWANQLSYYEQKAIHAADLTMNNLLDAYANKTQLVGEEALAETTTTTPEVSQLAKEIVEV